MKLGQIMKNIAFTAEHYDNSVEIADVVYDSRKVTPGALFVCITGFQADGHGFAENAYSRGARVFAVEKDISLPSDAIVLKVENTRILLALASANFFGNPAEKLNIIALTGTKGKTSTTFMLKSIYEAAGRKVGVIGTTGTYIGSRFFENENSTPESYLLHKYFAEMVAEGCDTAIIEATSQGFMLHRTYGINFSTGIFTNLSPDHIGAAEHRDFDDYLNCKKRIFTQSGRMIVNADCEFFARIIEGAVCPIITYGKDESADFSFSDPEFGIQGNRLLTTFTCREHGCDHRVGITAPGYFSLYNATSAIAAARQDGISYEEIQAGLHTAFVKGRMEIVPTGMDYTVIIDFAHNEYSVKTLFETIRLYKPNRIISVFGCGGNRSRLRRYSMGEVIGRNSDLSVITSDNPRYESVDSIIEDILVGMSRTDGKYIIVPDRAEAIKKALSEAGKGDVVLLIGKGHELYEEIEGIKYHFDEREVVREALSEALPKDN